MGFIFDLLAKSFLFISLLLSLVLSSIAEAQPTGEVLINEFLSNYSGDLESEWVELYNPYRNIADLSQYRLGDAIGWKTISDTALMLPGPGYIVLVQDIESFLNFYADFDGRAVELSSWPVLNNSGGDAVRLETLDGQLVDSIFYEEVFADNRSWERFIGSNNESIWGKSFDPSGSTPGRANSFFPITNTTIDMTISPNPFSPDGDGFEDQTIISWTPPAEGTFSLAMYDVSGRKIRTCVEDADAVPGEFLWDGRNDSGEKLPIGIYIVFARIDGDIEYETKLTVVIAR